MLAVLTTALSPGYETYAAMQKTRFEGKPSPTVSYCTVNEEGNVHLLVYGARQCFENIQGNEAAWAREALPEYFPTVCACGGSSVGYVDAGLEDGNCEAAAWGAVVSRGTYHACFENDREKNGRLG